VTAHAIERITARVSPEPNTGCWIWLGDRDSGGYGRLMVDGKRRSAHRFAWEIANGRPAPADREVCHRCDNPSCVNPDHLYAGTSRDNKLDCLLRGRHAWASRTHCKNGHEFNEANTRWATSPISGRAFRNCRRCASLATQRAHRKRMAARGGGAR
jgi:hypothetical protein